MSYLRTDRKQIAGKTEFQPKAHAFTTKLYCFSEIKTNLYTLIQLVDPVYIRQIALTPFEKETEVQRGGITFQRLQTFEVSKFKIVLRSINYPSI